MDSGRRGIDQHRRIARRPGRLKQVERSEQVDPQPKVEIRLGRAGDDGGEVKDHVKGAGHDRAKGSPVRDVAGQTTDPKRRRDGGRHAKVDKGERGNGPAPQRPVCGQTACQFLADEAAATRDENMHVFPRTSRRAG